jgi:hypothetical protein
VGFESRFEFVPVVGDRKPIHDPSSTASAFSSGEWEWLTRGSSSLVVMIRMAVMSEFFREVVNSAKISNRPDLRGLGEVTRNKSRVPFNLGGGVISLAKEFKSRVKLMQG